MTYQDTPKYTKKHLDNDACKCLLNAHRRLYVVEASDLLWFRRQ